MNGPGLDFVAEIVAGFTAEQTAVARKHLQKGVEFTRNPIARIFSMAGLAEIASKEGDYDATHQLVSQILEVMDKAKGNAEDFEHIRIIADKGMTLCKAAEPALKDLEFAASHPRRRTPIARCAVRNSASRGEHEAAAESVVRLDEMHGEDPAAVCNVDVRV